MFAESGAGPVMASTEATPQPHTAGGRARYVPDRPVSDGVSGAVTVTSVHGLTWDGAAQKRAGRSLPSWSCRFDPGPAPPKKPQAEQAFCLSEPG